MRDAIDKRLFLQMRVAWVRAMLSLSPSSWDDLLRGGARNQVGYAQGVTQANAEVFAGSCRAPASLGQLFYPRECWRVILAPSVTNSPPSPSPL